MLRHFHVSEMMVKMLVVMLAIAACLNSQVEARSQCGQCPIIAECDDCERVYDIFGGPVTGCSLKDWKNGCCKCSG